MPYLCLSVDFNKKSFIILRYFTLPKIGIPVHAATEPNPFDMQMAEFHLRLIGNNLIFARLLSYYFSP